MPFRALSVLEQGQLGTILEAGINASTYNMVAQYLAPRGFGWAQASGFARSLIPDFVPVDFAAHWYRPYQKERQIRLIEKVGADIQILEKNYIQHDLKEATRYMYEVEFDVFDDDGNVIDHTARAFYDDERLTPEDSEYEAEKRFTDKYPHADAIIGNFHLAGTYHNRMWDY